MKKIALNKKIIAKLDEPNKIIGGVTHTFEIGNTCEGQSCLCLSMGEKKTWCYCDDPPVLDHTKTCPY